MLQNAYLLAKIGADTAENKQHFAEICQKLATGSPVSSAAMDDAGRRELLNRLGKKASAAAPGASRHLVKKQQEGLCMRFAWMLHWL